MFSGSSSLIFETVFTRLLTYTFGNTAYAVSAVLVGFLGGLALGAFLIGKWVDRRPASLRIYAILELLVGGFCLLVPSLFGSLTRIYVDLYHRLNLGLAGLTAMRIALAAVLVLPPTFLMGGTLPVIARQLAALRPSFHVELDRLYASNTRGGALGVLCSVYVLIPELGIRGTITIACAINLPIFLWVMLASPQKAATASMASTASGQRGETAEPGERRAKLSALSGHSGLLLFASFLTGAVALTYEIVWTHALSFLIGNTVQAFGLMLFTFLAGLGLGARLVAKRLSRPRFWPRALVASQVFLGLTVFLTLPLGPKFLVFSCMASAVLMTLFSGLSLFS